VTKKNVRTPYPSITTSGLYDPNALARTQTVPTQQRKRVPPEQTHAENYYYKKQMEAKTPMVVVFRDGEVVRGTIEWYDKTCIKLHRNGEPNLLIFKRSIKYIYKDEKPTSSAEPEQAEPVKEGEATQSEG
jgi:sRNA-binding regulator protein Hfq